MWFNEIEYYMFVVNGLNVLVEMVNYIEWVLFEVFFFIEVCMIVGDGDWFSLFSNGFRMFIVVYVVVEDDYSWFFSDIELIFWKYGGWLYWGKLYFLWYGDFFVFYNDFESFWKLWCELDLYG